MAGQSGTGFGLVPADLAVSQLCSLYPRRVWWRGGEALWKIKGHHQGDGSASTPWVAPGPPASPAEGAAVGSGRFK